MKERTRKIFIMIVMAALIVSLMAASFAALTYGRYSGGRRDENSAYEDILDLVGETAFEVSTADELVNAINNGYSYIKVVGDDPTLVVNNNVADVVVNLVLDVNGHKIVRNSRNPLLNVRQSVSVVLVYDSSEQAEGGFYNPVGSALQTSGGTLTVGEGVYESGPRTGIGLDFSDTVSATVCSRDGRKAASYSAQLTNQTFPKLTEDTGDVYLTTSDASNSYLKADTYLIYTEEKNAFVRKAGDTVGGTVLQNEQLYVNAKEIASGGTTTISADKFSPICDVASCDFYYYYPVGTAGTANSPQTYAVVYGYNDVKTLAEDCTDKTGDHTDLSKKGLVWPYAAIRSEAGNTHARGGEFYTYFGEENTYSIYSEGGTMTVGLSGESDPPKFQAIGKGVCINMAGTSGNADQTLTIENGEFSSKIGDTIKMSGGEMEVKKGKFTKDATKDATGAPNSSTDNGSAISISGGTLNMAGSEKDGAKSVSFTVNGNYVNGIKMEKAENDTTANIADTIKNAAFSFNNNGFGNSVAAIQVIGGTLNVSDSTFTVNGFGNFGVHSSGGTVTATDCTFTMTQAGNPPDGRGDNFGIYSMLPEGATKGGTATAEGCTINITGTYSAGVLSMDGTLNLGASKTKETLITVSFEGNKLSSSGVSSEGGEINLTGNTTITSAGLGITARGEINVTGGTSTVKTERGTGIYVQNGTLTVEKGATVDVDSKIVDACSWVVPPEHTGDESLQTNKYNGVFVNGGSLVSNGILNVTFTGVKNDVQKESGDVNTNYSNQQTKSYAVRVEGDDSTNVAIASGTILNGTRDTNGTVIAKSGIGGGVLVNGGKVYLGATVTLDDNGNVTATKVGNPVSVSTTGTSMDMDSPTSMVGLEGMDGGTWGYRWNLTGGDAVKVVGGELFVYDGTYQAALGNGILVSNGNAAIEYGTFSGGGTLATTGAAATYAFKSYGGSVTIYDGNFTSASGGAFVMGTSVDTDDDQNIKIYGGKFDASAATAISAWNNATILFDPYCPLEGYDTDRILNVHGESTGLAIEVVTGDSQKITINGGDFKGDNRKNNNSNTNGIWYGNGGATLTITGGEFTGATNAGLDIEGNPGSIERDSEYQTRPSGWLYTFTDNRNILISGGTFTGGDSSIKSDERDLRVCDILYSELVDDLVDRDSSSYADVIIDTSIVTVNGTNYNSESTTEIRNSLARRTTITVSR